MSHKNEFFLHIGDKARLALTFSASVTILKSHFYQFLWISLDLAAIERWNGFFNVRTSPPNARSKTKAAEYKSRRSETSIIERASLKEKDKIWKLALDANIRDANIIISLAMSLGVIAFDNSSLIE